MINKTKRKDSNQRPRKSGARSKKKNIRKHTHALISSVEDYKADVNHQLRTGGLVSQMTDSALFSESAQPFNNKPSYNASQTSRKQKARQKQAELQKRLSGNQYITAVSPQNSALKQKRLSSSSSNSTGMTGKRKIIAQASSKPSTKNKSHPRNDGDTNTSNATTRTDLFDIWEKANSHPKLLSQKIGPEPTVDDRAVQLPLPGQSYNPMYEDHLELLRRVGKEELANLKRQARSLKKVPISSAGSYAEVQRDMINQVTKDLHENKVMRIPRSGATSTHSVSTKKKIIPGKQKTERKTKADRKKQLRHLQMLRRHAAHRARKRWRTQFHQLKTINRSLDALAAEQKIRLEKRKELRQKLLARPRRLSKYVVKPPPEDIKLTSELVPSLRQLKPEGNIFRDRLYSLVRRNIIEYRERHQRTLRRYGGTYESRSHKAFSESLEQRLQDTMES